MANEWRRGTFTYDAVGQSHTTTNIINAFTSFLTQNGWSVPGWSASATDRYFVRSDHGSSDVWHYTGDGPTQKCGIRVFVSGNSIRIRPFLENQAANGAQIDIGATQEMVITVDNTAPNNYLLIGGEFGLYVEAGRDGLPSNLGHGFVGTFLPIPEFYGSKDAQRKWTAQGFCCDLVGTLKFSAGRTGSQSCFIVNDGTNRAFSPALQPTVCRGTTSVYNNAQVNTPYGALSHRRLAFSTPGNVSTGISPLDLVSTFGFSWLAAQNNARYVISEMLFAPSYNGSATTNNYATAVATVATGATTGSPSNISYADPSSFWRKVEKFAVVEYTLTPWANITDAVSGLAYRVANVPDGGRTARIAIQWPDSGNVTTISLT
jgi:hypothetical protein